MRSGMVNKNISSSKINSSFLSTNRSITGICQIYFIHGQNEYFCRNLNTGIFLDNNTFFALFKEVKHSKTTRQMQQKIQIQTSVTVQLSVNVAMFNDKTKSEYLYKWHVRTSEVFRAEKQKKKAPASESGGKTQGCRTW